MVCSNLQPGLSYRHAVGTLAVVTWAKRVRPLVNGVFQCELCYVGDISLTAVVARAFLCDCYFIVHITEVNGVKVKKGGGVCGGWNRRSKIGAKLVSVLWNSSRHEVSWDVYGADIGLPWMGTHRHVCFRTPSIGAHFGETLKVLLRCIYDCVVGLLISRFLYCCSFCGGLVELAVVKSYIRDCLYSAEWVSKRTVFSRV